METLIKKNNRDPSNHLRNPENGFMESDYAGGIEGHPFIIFGRGCLARNFLEWAPQGLSIVLGFQLSRLHPLKLDRFLELSQNLRNCVSLVWSEALPYRQNHGFVVNILLEKDLQNK